MGRGKLNTAIYLTGQLSKLEVDTMKEKKKWTTPQLIVLVRGEPEEGVLAACKTDLNMVGNNGAYGACQQEFEPCEACAFLSAS